MYGSVPTVPNDSYWPRGCVRKGKSIGNCPECEASWVTYRALNGCPGNSQGLALMPVPAYPHVFYECGGGWRQVYDHWEGFCGVPKTRQLEIEFTV